MARKQLSGRDVQQVANLVRQLPPKVLLLLIVLVIIGAGGYYLATRPAARVADKPVPKGALLFCSWNVENFYDDQADPKNDDRLENLFAGNPELFKQKVDQLAEALLMMNDGRGPDIMALCEVESERCMTALKDELNERLTKAGKGDVVYDHVLFKGDKLGRRFAPGILTRLGVEGDRTRKISNNAGNGRTLEGHLKANGHDLIVMAAHWTSRVDNPSSKETSDEPANAKRRMSYAQDCYGRFKAIVLDNPDADVILCGDFNDDFKDPAIQEGLHATGDMNVTRNAIDEPRPFDLFASWPKDGNPPGTIYGRGHWSIFDHILISRGLLDNTGWSCDPTTASIFAPPQMRHSGKKSKGEPLRFGESGDAAHGYSDHFPVVVQLRLK